MEYVNRALDAFYPALPSFEVIIITLLVLIGVRFFLNKRYRGALELRFRRQVVTMLILFVGMLALIMVLPIGDMRRGQLLSLLGILLSAAIALSSTTLLGNLMAGFMLRAVRNFRAGDFVRVGDQFGRVSDRGLFHVEVQTEDRDLTTLSNIYLVSNPVTVSRSSGTVVSATVSIGYDVPRKKIAAVLTEAALEAQLADPFVHILELGDFSVTYKVAGLLTEVKLLISVRSRLRELMLDKLHDADIEIVSPTFMNQRPLRDGHVFIPDAAHAAEVAHVEPADLPEEVVFDKAEEAESTEKLKEAYESLGEKRNETKKLLDEAGSDEEKEGLKTRLEQIETRRKRLAEIIERRNSEKPK